MLVGYNPAAAEAAAAALLRRGALRAELGDYDAAAVRRQQTYGASRVDFVLPHPDGSLTLLEVKNVVRRPPPAPSARPQARKQGIKPARRFWAEERAEGEHKGGEARASPPLEGQRCLRTGWRDGAGWRGCVRARACVRAHVVCVYFGTDRQTDRQRREREEKDTRESERRDTVETRERERVCVCVRERERERERDRERERERGVEIGGEISGGSTEIVQHLEVLFCSRCDTVGFAQSEKKLDPPMWQGEEVIILPPRYVQILTSAYIGTIQRIRM